MAATHPDRLLTIDDLEQIPDDGYQYELVQGRLVRTPPSFTWSSYLAMELARLLANFIVQHNLGYFSGSDGGVITGRNPDSVRAPDFSFVSRARMPGGRPRRRQYFPAPDLAVEVLGESDRMGKMTAKALEYLAAGTRLVWVLDPFERTTLIFRPGQPPEVLTAEATLTGEDVLPGFSLSLPELWRGLDEEEEQTDTP